MKGARLLQLSDHPSTFADHNRGPACIHNGLGDIYGGAFRSSCHEVGNDLQNDGLCGY